MKTGTSALALAAIALATTVACSSDDATKKDVTVTIVAYESFTPPRESSTPSRTRPASRCGSSPPATRAR